MLHKEELLETFLSLVGAGGRRKPFECVGTAAEAGAAAHLAAVRHLRHRRDATAAGSEGDGVGVGEGVGVGVGEGLPPVLAALVRHLPLPRPLAADDDPDAVLAAWVRSGWKRFSGAGPPPRSWIDGRLLPLTTLPSVLCRDSDQSMTTKTARAKRKSRPWPGPTSSGGWGSAPSGWWTLDVFGVRRPERRHEGHGLPPLNRVSFFLSVGFCQRLLRQA